MQEILYYATRPQTDCNGQRTKESLLVCMYCSQLFSPQRIFSKPKLSLYLMCIHTYIHIHIHSHAYIYCWKNITYIYRYLNTHAIMHDLLGPKNIYIFLITFIFFLEFIWSSWVSNFQWSKRIHYWSEHLNH